MEENNGTSEGGLNKELANKGQTDPSLVTRRAMLQKGARNGLAGAAGVFLGLGMMDSTTKRADSWCYCSCCTLGCGNSCFYTCDGCSGCQGGCEAGCLSACTGCTGTCQSECTSDCTALNMPSLPAQQGQPTGGVVESSSNACVKLA